MSPQRSALLSLLPVVTLAACQTIEAPTAVEEPDLPPPAAAAPAPPFMQWSETFWNFEYVAVGQTSSKVFTITNSGGAARGLVVELLVNVPTTDLRIVANTCGRNLKAGASCDVTVQLAPTSTMIYEAELIGNAKTAGVGSIRLLGYSTPPE